MKLTNITKMVKSILENFPETRDDDYLLWLYVLDIKAEERQIPNFANTVSVRDFLQGAKYSTFPHYETISRARRKAQEKYPELRATEETRNFRAMLEERYRAYAKERV